MNVIENKIEWKSAGKNKAGQEAFRATISIQFSVAGSDDRGLKEHSVSAGIAPAGNSWKYGARSTYLPNGASKYSITISGSSDSIESAKKEVAAAIIKAAEALAIERSQNASRQYRPVQVCVLGY